uniref:Uncharacterized protein n=1 Tax=Amphimedon queenslandica TaxID=400682 RepID=A0A1X7U2L8_AMPQE
MTGLRHPGIDISSCISQCYDGAYVLRGHLSGVRKRVNDLNLAAIYMYFHANQLNLVFVDTCKKVDHAASFFSLLDCVYIFLLSSVAHSLIMAKQKELHFRREIQLKKLSDTRMSCRYTSIKGVLTTLQAHLFSLEELTEDITKSIEARRLLLQVCSFQFLLSLILFEHIFFISNNLPTLLQSEKISYAAAASCIKGTMLTIANLRSDHEWSQIWAQAVPMAEKCSITVTPLRQMQQ